MLPLLPKLAISQVHLEPPPWLYARLAHGSLLRLIYRRFSADLAAGLPAGAKVLDVGTGPATHEFTPRMREQVTRQRRVEPRTYRAPVYRQSPQFRAPAPPRPAPGFSPGPSRAPAPAPQGGGRGGFGGHR